MSEGKVSDGKYLRQVEVFGVEGQLRISEAKVCVLGLGGLGSHVCQQMAYLGATHFVIADKDVVDESNLNRLIGATEEDIGIPKSVVLERLIAKVQPSAVVERISEMMPHDDINSAVASTDIVVGCFDNDFPRMLTTELTSQFGIPYVDAASGIIVAPGSLDFGGRVVVAGTSPGCLHCMGMLDQDEIRRAQLNDEQLAQEAKLYGVPVESLRGTGPSVVNVNGVVASLAVVEAMFILSGGQSARKIVAYRGAPGWVTYSAPPRDDCYYCALWAERVDA